MTKTRVLCGSIVVAYLAMIVAAQLGEIQPKPPENSLRWGGDETGGAPYIYSDEDGERTGFEVELAQTLAEEMEMNPWFVQGAWDKLPSRLHRGDIDVVLNGYEWTKEREKEWSSTIPYYVYSLKLLVHKDNNTIESWDDLRRKPGGKRLRVGVLSNTAAHRYLEREYGDDIKIEAYSEGVTSAMRLVAQKSLDATVQDSPAVVHYMKDEEKFGEVLTIVEPEREVQPGFYVMFVAHKNIQLLDQLNRVIKKLLGEGKLRELYEKYGLWTDAQEKQLNDAADAWPPVPRPAIADSALTEFKDSMTEDWWKHARILARAAWTTVLLSCISMPLAMMLGLMVALGRLYAPAPIPQLMTAYVEFLRGTPLLMQLFVIYFILPSVGINLEPFWAGVLGLAVNYSAYEAENYRAGLLAVPVGQMEAALALGMRKWTALRRIIVPQAVRIVIPPVTNDFIALFKDTSVCSVIAVTELTGKYSGLSNDQPGLFLQFFVQTAILYLLMSYPLAVVARRLEKRFTKAIA